jgi:hypothetical protein
MIGKKDVKVVGKMIVKMIGKKNVKVVGKMIDRFVISREISAR